MPTSSHEEWAWTDLLSKIVKSVEMPSRKAKENDRRRGIPPQGPTATFFAECELDHICPRESGALSLSPGGASRFQCPGLARPLALYCAGRPCSFWGVVMPDGLSRGSSPRPRRLVICVPQQLFAEYASHARGAASSCFAAIPDSKASGNPWFQCGFDPEPLQNGPAA